jgi:hypothetical protein
MFFYPLLILCKKKLRVRTILGSKSLGPLKKTLETADYMFFTHKNVISCTIRNSGPFIDKTKGTFLDRIIDCACSLSEQKIWLKPDYNFGSSPPRKM